MIKSFLILLTIFFMTASTAFAEPDIVDVSGQIADNQQITINGSNFGSNGPNVELFDDFNRGIIGDDMSLNASLGAWSSAGTYYPRITGGGLSGSKAMSTNRGAPNYGKLIKLFHGAQEVFLSYWLKIPAGTNFPGASLPLDCSTSTGGWFKQIWFMNNNGTSDPVMPYGNYSSNNNIVPFSWDGHGWIVGSNNDITNFSPSNAIYNNTWWNWSDG